MSGYVRMHAFHQVCTQWLVQYNGTQYEGVAQDWYRPGQSRVLDTGKDQYLARCIDLQALKKAVSA